MVRQAAGRSFAGLLLLSTAMAMGFAPLSEAFAAQQVQQESGLLIRSIEVTGNQRIEAGTVRSYLPVEPGMQVGSLEIDAALKSLFATGLFEDAEVLFDPRRGVLTVNVLENPIVNRVVFEGNKRTKAEKFEEEIQLEPRSVYTRAKAQADAQRVIEVYRRSGRFGATVVPKIKRLDQNRVDVVFDIDEGPKSGIKAVNFVGNTAFTDAELRGAILTAPSRWWNIFESNDNYDPDRLEYEQQLLTEFYSKNGYADFSVVSSVAELTPDRKDFIVTFTVEEGPKYSFGSVDVNTTLSKLPGRLLRARIPIRSGTTFNSELVEKAEESITFATGAAGYAFVDINPRLDRNPENNTVDITFDVNEGPRVYVEEININGNVQTLDPVIRREMRVIEGDAYNRIGIDRSERRVKGLGFFSDVVIEEEPGSAPDRTILNVNVTEQPTGSFQVGGGASSNDNFIFNVSVEQRNLLGRGQYVLLDLQAAQRTKQARLSITEPRFLGRQLRAGASVFYNATDFEEAGFVSDTVGFNVNAGFPSSEFSSLLVNYGLRYDNVEFPTRRAVGQREEGGDLFLLEQTMDGEGNNVFGFTDFTIDDILIEGSSFDRLGDIPIDTDGDGFLAISNPGIVRFDSCSLEGQQVNFSCARNGEFVTSQVGYTFRMDKTNDPIVPSAGYDFTISQSFAGLGGDVNFHRTTIRAGTYKRLPFRLIGSLKFNGGYVDSFDNDGVRINDRFFLGGNRIIRGFDVAGVGPRLFQAGATGRAATRGQSIGARAYAVGTAEALLPLPLPPSYGIRASLFVDGGYIGGTSRGDDALFNTGEPTLDFFGDEEFDDPLQNGFDPRVTAGVSVNWNSPFGPIQVDLSEALIAEPYDRPLSFRFSAGGRF
ncbi:outer membrane protein assembly factor BamA [Parvularcula maris]|uniref:Outer membrane protein assembly factor BamA n=1 Tax=Parvularcula maris TaxID=2965077 RepID=A0A9X2RKE8_9PROT|nr:outer membrane protein assembly factor BamA [Parvularcula maris]MCQ8185552.1 outer membrane protein assembly factor BamA [Parvularcula maris]